MGVLLAQVAGLVAMGMMVAPISASSMPQGGPAEAHSDFNGDGFADLAIGVPYETVRGTHDAGGVNVLYGSPLGLSATRTRDQFWSHASRGVEDAPRRDDLFGEGLAPGDFNGDGYGDLAIGVPGEDSGRPRLGLNSGAVHVLYGSSSGLSPTAVVPDQLWTQDSPGVEDQIDASDDFGRILAGGDFNGDGYADQAIGVPLEDLGGHSDAGVVHLLYGSASGLSATTVPDQLWTQDSPEVEGSPAGGDKFGAALAAGDFNGEGYDDLAIGVPLESTSQASHSGAVSVLYGSDEGLSATSALPDQLWTQDSPDVEGEANYLDGFGWALAAADFGGGSQSDLAIAARSQDREVSEINVLYGSGSGLSATEYQDHLLNLHARGLAASDFGGSIHADLALGNPDTEGAAIGWVHVVYGSTAGLTESDIPDQRWTQNSPGVEDTAESGDRFGWAVAAGNFDGDLTGDLAIGVQHERVGDGFRAGAVNVLHGSAAGLSATATPDQFWTQDSPGVQNVAGSGDEFGRSMTAGSTP